jgi:hypothetical protein
MNYRFQTDYSSFRFDDIMLYDPLDEATATEIQKSCLRQLSGKDNNLREYIGKCFQELKRILQKKKKMTNVEISIMNYHDPSALLLKISVEGVFGKVLRDYYKFSLGSKIEKYSWRTKLWKFLTRFATILLPVLSITTSAFGAIHGIYAIHDGGFSFQNSLELINDAVSIGSGSKELYKAITYK